MLNTLKCVLVFSSLLITEHINLCHWALLLRMLWTSKHNSFGIKNHLELPWCLYVLGTPSPVPGTWGTLDCFSRIAFHNLHSKKIPVQFFCTLLTPKSKSTVFRKCRSCSLHPLMMFSSADPAFQGHLIKKIIEYLNSIISNQTIKPNRDMRIEPWLLELKNIYFFE